ncbi:hypothetical protein FJT64_019697 [Amphibalanus amphitrite]|uniref:Uncharacterized protein n=1 Tax=Amphibalanus amphitrite TaxID=1232801 RepID=A0A6A4WP62_AMPAM|nr:hypothetical protein FJT64_019697 [Amphibalanus amphitrite]
MTDSGNNETLHVSMKENTKTTGYGLIMLGGIGVTAVMFYAIFRELFSSKSPNLGVLGGAAAVRRGAACGRHSRLRR